jgi:GNAT superfamily N-acetyltransferase
MGTTFTVSRATEADEESIIELERLVWGAAEEATPEYFQWLTYMNPSGQAITHIAKDDSGQVISMHIVLPAPALLKGKQIQAGISINIATHPDYRRNGLSTRVAKSVYQEAKQSGIDFLFSVPNPVSKGLFTGQNGFVELSSPLMLSRWIDPSIFLSQHGFNRLEKLSKLLTKPFLNHSRKSFQGKTRIRFLERLEDLKLEQILEPVDFCIAPTADWLKWRYENHPFRKYECAIVGKPDCPEVLVIFHVIEQYGRALIMEFLVAQDTPLQTVQSLLDGVVEKCEAKGCSSLIGLGMPNSRKATLLKKSGFWVFPFSSVWRPKLVYRCLTGIPGGFSLESMDFTYGALVNIE